MTNPLLDAARRTVPTLLANAARTEQDLTPAPDSVAAVRAAGLFALTVPRAHGGHEADRRTLVEVLAELGRGCPSTAWVVGLNASNKAVPRLTLTERAQAAALDDPNAVICASAVASGTSSTRVPGGLRVSGRWAMASGSEVATAAIVGVPLPDTDPPAAAMTLIPLTDLSVERTWKAAGLSGTSSHTLVADNAFVPDAFVVSPTAAAPKQPISPEAVFIGGLAALSPMIGATLGAQDLVAESMTGPRAPYMTTYAHVADSPLARYWFTEAQQRTTSARQRTLHVADLLDNLPPGESLPVTDRITLRTQLTTAARECREAMELLLDLHGASGFADQNPLQRFWRDVAVGTRHPFFTPYTLAEDQGRLTFNHLPLVNQIL